MSDSPALAENTPFNHKPCTVLGYEDCWVRFKTSGYPRKMRREWDAEKDPDKILQIVLSHVEAWQLRDVDGTGLALSGDIAVLDNAEDALAIWLVRTFQQFWLLELPNPRKNS